jgi:hypothetical protein
MTTIEMSELRPGDCLIIEVFLFGRQHTYGVGVYGREEPAAEGSIDYPTLKTVLSVDLPGHAEACWTNLPATGAVAKDARLPWYREARVISASKNGEVAF